MSRTGLLAGIAAILWGGGASAGDRQDAGKRQEVHPSKLQYPIGDPEMAAATLKARATLPRFIELADAGLRGSYLLKMPLTDGVSTEHIWMEVSGYGDGIFTGRLANDPTTEGHRLGDPATLHGKDVEDWMINTGKARYGGYTVRVLLKDMPHDQAEDLRRQFKD